MNNERYIKALASFREVHGNRYQYFPETFTKVYKTMKMACKEHGEFWLKPNLHSKGKGCQKCSKHLSNTKLKKTVEDFKIEANKVHNFMYNYDLVKDCGYKNTIQISCPDHGVFTQNVVVHLSGSGCQKCGIASHYVKTCLGLDKFLKRCEAKHGETFDYSKTKYSHSREISTFICKLHGEFEQTPRNHLRSATPCPTCSLNRSTIKLEHFVKIAKGNLCTFYIIKCFNEIESFYKFGITKNDVSTRYKTVRDMPYSYTTILEIKGGAKYIWELEQVIKNIVKNFKYNPIKKFSGSVTECIINIDSVIEYLNKSHGHIMLSACDFLNKES